MREKRARRKADFMSGVLTLSLSTVLVKIIGLVYKIPMLRLLGSEGMGYFNSAYEIYTLFCSVATTGLPVAMTVLIASKRDRFSERAIFQTAIKLFLLLGIVGSGIMMAFAMPFADFLGSNRAACCIIAIAPTVFLICISSAFRGFFQGKSRMLPIALSQIIEAAGKLVLGLIFANVALNAGLGSERVAACAVIGLALGTAISLTYLAFTKRLCRVNDDGVLYGEGSKGITSELLKVAVPVTASSLIASVTRVIDMSLILRLLGDSAQSGETAFAIYGNYTTLAIPLFSLAPALISAVATPLIPSLSRAISAKDAAEQKKVVGDAIRLTMLISMPISFGLTIFSEPILNMLFSGESAAITSSAPLLSLLGLSVPLSCMITVGNAVLQAYGRASVPIFSMTFGSALKIATAYLLVGNPNIGIVGAPISTFVCDLAINLVNFYFISLEMPDHPPIGKIAVRPALAALASVASARVVYNAADGIGCSEFYAAPIAIVLAALAFFALAFMLGAVDKEDLARLVPPKEKLHAYK